VANVFVYSGVAIAAGFVVLSVILGLLISIKLLFSNKDEAFLNVAVFASTV